VQTGYVEVNIEEALLDIQRPFLKEQIADLKAGHNVTPDSNLATGKFPCYGLYHLDGGTLAVGALEEKFWQGFCNEIGRPDLIPRQFTTGVERDKVRGEVLAALSRRPFAVWVQAFADLDCCVEPVLSVAEAARFVEGGL
jgi:crotonobetainyl-CoA:carnitine CoA-transferase CaiB-like acyl-CoA transferase